MALLATSGSGSTLFAGFGVGRVSSKFAGIDIQNIGLVIVDFPALCHFPAITASIIRYAGQWRQGE